MALDQINIVVLPEDTWREIVQWSLLAGDKIGATRIMMVLGKLYPDLKSTNYIEPLVFTVNVHNLIADFRTTSLIYEISVDWGDGSEYDTIKNEEVFGHQYQINGNYRVRIFNIYGFDNIQFYESIDRLLTIGQLTSCDQMFSYVNFNKPLILDTQRVVNMSYMFYSSEYFNQPLNWDTSNVTDMTGMFRDTPRFSQILHWDVTKVVDDELMFYNSGGSLIKQ